MGLLAKNIMSDSVLTVNQGASCEEVMQLLIDKRVTGVPVVDDNGDLVGIITMRDIIRVKVELAYMPSMFDLKKGFVSEYMSTKVYSAYPETPMAEICKKMAERHFHRVVIINPDDLHKPVGIITTFDLLKVVAELN